jgi:aspartate-semialdehyde dehydrogenase
MVVVYGWKNATDSLARARDGYTFLSILYSCSAVRIPTIRAHSEVIIVETVKPVDIAAARKALEEAPGVKLVDDTANLQYPMPLTATGAYDVEVGRIRKSLIFGDYGLEFFVSGDQLLRGAALNAVLVAEEMNKNGALEAFAKQPVA